MKVNEQSKKQHLEDVFAVSDQNATKKLSLFSHLKNLITVIAFVLQLARICRFFLLKPHGFVNDWILRGHQHGPWDKNNCKWKQNSKGASITLAFVKVLYSVHCSRNIRSLKMMNIEHWTCIHTNARLARKHNFLHFFPLDCYVASDSSFSIEKLYWNALIKNSRFDCYQ